MKKNTQMLKQNLIALLFVLVSTLSFSQSKLEKKADELYGEGNYLHAIRYYEKAYKKDASKKVVDNLIYCYKKENQKMKLLNFYKRINDSGTSSYNKDYGQELLKLKKYDQAKEVFSSYLGINSNDSLVINLLKYIDVASGAGYQPNCNENKERKYCVDLSAVESIDLENPSIIFIWEFSDGKKYTGVKCSRCFDESGTYNVSLSAKDKTTGNVDNNVANEEIVFEKNFLFTINTSGGKVFLSDKAIDLKVSASDKYIYIWEFGDGTFMYGNEVKKIYDIGSSYMVKLHAIEKSTNSLKSCTKQRIFVKYSIK